MKAHIAALPMIWIKSTNGNTYVCPVGAIKDPQTATEEELRRKCVDEGNKPYND